MTLEEYRNKLAKKTQGNGSSSASSGLAGYREYLAKKNPGDYLQSIYDEIGESYTAINVAFNQQDTAGAASAMAAVNRNMKKLQWYSEKFPNAGVKTNLSTIIQDYNTMQRQYDRMTQEQAAEQSPMLADGAVAGGLNLNAGVSMGGVTPALRGVDEDKLTRQIRMTPWAASGIQRPETELAELEGKTWLQRAGGNLAGAVRSAGSWAKNVGAAAAQGFAADYGEMAALGAETLQQASDRGGYLDQALVDLQTLVQERENLALVLGESDANVLRLDAAIEAQQEKIRTYSSEEDFRQSQRDALAETDAWVDARHAASETAMNKALEGSAKLGTLGQWITMGSVATLQMLGDAALGGMSSTTARSFGAGIKEGEENGYDTGGQLAMGIKTAAITFLTEKAFGGNPLIDGDKLGFVGRLAQKISGNRGLQMFMRSAPVGAAMEGLEEVLESGANWLVNKAVGADTDDVTLESLVDDFVVGMLVGAGGQAVNKVIRTAGLTRNEQIIGEAIVESGNLPGMREAAAFLGVKTGELTTAREVGHTYNLVQDVVLNEAVRDRVTELGGSADTTLGEAIISLSRDKNLTRSQRKAYYASNVADQVVAELQSAMEGDVSDGNRWVEHARVLPSELGHIAARQRAEVQPGETAAQEPVAETANAPERGTITEESVPNAPESGVVKAEVPSQRQSFEHDVAEIADVDGMTDEAAMTWLTEQMRRTLVSIQEAEMAGDEARAQYYEQIRDLMVEATVAGGNDPKAIAAYLKGAINGNDISDGAGRRNAGERAGIETGAVGSQRHEDNGRGPADGRTDRPGYVQTSWESAEDLGVPGGTSEKVNGRVPRSQWTREMTVAYDEAVALGYSLEYVTGGIHVRNDVTGGVMTVTGATYGESIVVQADHSVYSPKQIADHEIAHVRIKKDPAILMEAEERLIAQYDEMEVFNMVAVYAQGFRFCYGSVTESMTADEIAELNQKYLEELVCDAYAGLNRHFARGAGRNVSKYSDSVIEIMESRIGMGNGSGGMPGVRYSFAGENAETANERRLGAARSMADRGVDPEKVRQLTGWHQGRDGLWRFEIDDSMMKLRSTALVNYMTLKDILDHEALFAAYPVLQDVNIIFQDMKGRKGSFNPQFYDINLDYSLRGNEEELLDVLSHEIQHAIQDIEGFTPGASEAYWEERIRKGYDNRTRAAIEEEGHLRDEYERIQREEPEFFREMLELDDMSPTVPRGAVDYETLEQIEEDPPEWHRYDARREVLEEKYGDVKVFDFIDLLHNISQSGQRGRRTPGDLYWSTYGEGEARDVEIRRNLTAEQRRETVPYRGNKDVVFAGDSGFIALSAESEETLRIKEQLQDGAEAIADMEPVADIKIPARNWGNKPLDRKWAMEQLKYTGYRVDRQGFGEIVIDEKRINDGLRYLNTPGEIAAIVAIPRVLKRGRVIGGHENHKSRGYETVTIAAPVILNGSAGNMAVVVRREPGKGKSKAYYKVHRILTPEGKAYELPKMENTEPTPAGGESVSSSLTSPISSVSKTSISESGENSNYNFRFSADDEGKAPEEMTATELRRAIKGDQSMLDAYAQIERTGGLTPEVKAERDAVRARLDRERELLHRESERAAQERKSVRERTRARTAPTRAKADFRKEMLDIFSTRSGMRAELGTMVERFSEDVLNRGAVSYQDRERLIDRLYEAGVMTVEADPYYQDIRNNIAGTRIYVDEGTRIEFGDSESWTEFRRKAFAAGVILTSENSDYHIDGFYEEMASMYPGTFRHASGDTKGMLEEIVTMAEQGKAENVSLAEMMRQVEKDRGWSIEEQMDILERKVDTAIDKFVEKAKLETDLKARSAVQIAQEREQRRKSMERQAEARNMREMQRRTMKSLQWLKKNEHRLPEEIKAQAQELLDGLDLYAISIANEMRWSDKHQATWRDLADMYRNAKDHDPNFLPSKELEMIWSRVNLKKVGELDLDALDTLYKAASALRTEYYNRNNVINDEEHRLFSEAYHDSVEELRSSGGKGKLGTWFNAEQLTPVNVMEMMGGWRRNGQFFSFARMLERGERDYKGYVVEANRVLQEFIEEHQDWIKTADGQGKNAKWYTVEVPELLELHMGDKPIFGETKTVYMTPAQKVHLYLESMNHQNLRHMAGGRTFVNRELYSQGKRTEALAQGTTIRLAPETVKRLVSDLTEEEMALAKVLQQYYNIFASQRINGVSNSLYGYDKAVTRDYAPIFSNRNYTKTEPGVYDVTAEGVGHMKGREQYSANPSYNISAFDAFERHVEQTARFVGYSIPVRNINTLMNWRVQGSSMRDEITHAWGEEGAKYVEDYVTKLQSPTIRERSTIQKASGKLLSNYISGVFAANPSVVLKQLLSYPMAGSVLGFNNLPTPAQIARTDSELIARYTPELEYRRMGYATPELKQLKDNPNWTQTNKVVRFIFGGGAITWTDAGAAKALWPWAENYVKKNFPDLEVGTQEQIDAGQSPFYRKVAEVYNDAVTNTQSMSDISHRPKIMNSDSDITKAFTMFKSDSAQAYNSIRRLTGELTRAAKDGDKTKARTVRKNLAAGVTAVILSQLGGEAINFLMALWKNKAKWYRDEEDELTAESVGREYLNGLAESTAGIVLGGEQLMAVVLAFINGEDWSTGGGIEVPGAEQLNDFIDTTLSAAVEMKGIINGAVEVVQNDGDLGQYLSRNSGDILGIVKDTAVNMAQYLAGVPASNLEKYLLGTVKWMCPELGAAYDSLFSSPAKDSLTGLEGEALAATVGDVLAIRDIQSEDGTSTELARLYEAGWKGSVPGDAPEKFAVNGEDFVLNAATTQDYERVYAEAIGGNLDLMVASEAYKEADDELREKMLSRLYTYATDAAKRAVNPDYAGSKWTLKAAEAEEEGVPAAVYAALQAQGYTRMADQMDYIDGMDLSNTQKGVLYYNAVASDSRVEDADEKRAAGVSWATIFTTAYDEIDAERDRKAAAADKAARGDDAPVEPVGWIGTYPGVQLPVW